MKKLNLRVRLLIFLILISAAVFITAGVLSWKEASEKVDEFFDTYQIALARRLSTTDWTNITHEMQKISDKLVDDIHNAEDEDESIGFAVFNNEGERIFHDGENGRYFPPFGRKGSFGTERIDDEKWRVIRLMSTDNRFIVAVGQELDYRNEIVEDMFEEFMTPWAIGWGVMLLAIILMLTKEFAPLNRLARQLKQRKGDDLSPLDETDIPGEVKPLTSAVNYLLNQTQEMLQREKSFIADSAHELEQLLAFSRIEAGFENLPGESSPIDWQQIATQIAEDYTPAAQAKNINLVLDIAGKAPFEQGNPIWAALMLKNMVDNAIKYSPEKATVSISIKYNKIKVCNSNTVVEEDKLKHLGQRFYRPAGQKTTGSGLGISIIMKIAALYRCRVAFANTDEGFCVSILPLKD